MVWKIMGWVVAEGGQRARAASAMGSQLSRGKRWGTAAKTSTWYTAAQNHVSPDQRKIWVSWRGLEAALRLCKKPLILRWANDSVM